MTGAAPGTLSMQWSSLSDSESLLALAPEDEILGELLTLQAELAVVTAANRARLGPLLDAVRQDLPAQGSAATERDAQTDTIKEYILVRHYGVPLQKEKLINPQGLGQFSGH